MAGPVDPTAETRVSNRSQGRRLPAWALLILASLLAFALLVAIGFTAAHTSEGGALWPVVLVPALLGGLSLACCVLGYRRLAGGPRSWSRPVAILVIGTIGLGVLGAVAGGFDERSGDLLFPPWMIVATLVFAIGVSVLMWRRMDEAAREAHKWAWYWGATLGIALSLPLFFFEGQSVRIRDQLGLGDSFAEGAWSVLLLQMAGYGLAWGFWWLRRR